MNKLPNIAFRVILAITVVSILLYFISEVTTSQVIYPKDTDSLIADETWLRPAGKGYYILTENENIRLLLQEEKFTVTRDELVLDTSTQYFNRATIYKVPTLYNLQSLDQLLQE